MDEAAAVRERQNLAPLLVMLLSRMGGNIAPNRK